ncbi:MAG: hypothetical protein QM762_26390 [Chryseolinea sp.]
MKTIKIKTYRLNSQTTSLHFFILSKGYNAGKPLEKPCPNCFIIEAKCLAEKSKLYWICYSLWKSGAYLPFLCGSVIPFLHISDASSRIELALQNVDVYLPNFDKGVYTLQQLMQLERTLELQLKIIAELKATTAKKLLS